MEIGLAGDLPSLILAFEAKNQACFCIRFG